MGWPGAVIYPLGIAGFAVFILWRIHVLSEKSRKNGQEPNPAVLLKVIGVAVVVAGISLYYLQITPASSSGARKVDAVPGPDSTPEVKPNSAPPIGPNRVQEERPPSRQHTSLSPPSSDSSEWKAFQGQYFSVSYPKSWHFEQTQLGISVTPDGGLISTSTGPYITGGFEISVFPMRSNDRGDFLVFADSVVNEFVRRNAGFVLTESTKPLDTNPNDLVAEMRGISPRGENEIDIFYWFQRENRAILVLLVASSSNADSLQPIFPQVLHSFHY